LGEQTFKRYSLIPALATVGLLAATVIMGGVMVRSTVHAQCSPPTATGIPVHFTDVSEVAGITFRHDATMSAEKEYIETMGNGLGWIDYDQDGLMDLYLVQSTAAEWYKPSRPLRSALYHNNGDGTFTDVTEKARVGAEGFYGHGVAVGDYDLDPS
jgi:hypothetical protein